VRNILLLAMLLAATQGLHAQGCAQCRDNAAATTPQTQAGYRRAITLLVAGAATVFTGTVLMLRRAR
jgi:hypothetical protein